jgi:ABC-type nitrate/sulfonate/bicarbonate transport system permease component
LQIFYGRHHSAVPYIVTGMRVAVASSFMSIIPAEIWPPNSGIGYLLQKSSICCRPITSSWRC